MNLSGADLSALVTDATMMAARDTTDKLQSMYDEYTESESSDPLSLRAWLANQSSETLNVRVGQRHFDSALSALKPSLTREELMRYDALREQMSRK